jgi:hypothetical protein
MFHSRAVRRIFTLVPVAALHVIGIAVLVGATGRVSSTVHSDETLVTVFLQPTIRDDGGSPSGPDLPLLTIPLISLENSLNLSVLAIGYETSRNTGATIAAPSLMPNSSVSMATFVAQAALQPGEGATVVLRIQVLASGEPGDIEIDGSSGNHLIDLVAVEYARTQRWYSGRVGNYPETMWIRWGVRLQA